MKTVSLVSNQVITKVRTSKKPMNKTEIEQSLAQSQSMLRRQGISRRESLYSNSLFETPRFSIWTFLRGEPVVVPRPPPLFAPWRSKQKSKRGIRDSSFWFGSRIKTFANFWNYFTKSDTQIQKAKPEMMRPATIFLGQRRRGDRLARAEKGSGEESARASAFFFEKIGGYY